MGPCHRNLHLWGLGLSGPELNTTNQVVSQGLAQEHNRPSARPRNHEPKIDIKYLSDTYQILADFWGKSTYPTICKVPSQGSWKGSGRGLAGVWRGLAGVCEGSGGSGQRSGGGVGSGE